jgi:hypothetical protein
LAGGTLASIAVSIAACVVVNLRILPRTSSLSPAVAAPSCVQAGDALEQWRHTLRDMRPH